MKGSKQESKIKIPCLFLFVRGSFPSFLFIYFSHFPFTKYNVQGYLLEKKYCDMFLKGVHFTLLHMQNKE